jgi:hypothetical protein
MHLQTQRWSKKLMMLIDPALDRQDGQPTVEMSTSQRVSEVSYCKGCTPAEPDERNVSAVKALGGRLSRGERICGRRS